MTDLIPQPKSLTLSVDWRATFKAFCYEHGNQPVVYKNTLLFEDGWAYAMDYMGPEFPPPEDEYKLFALLRKYWKLRQKAVLVRRDELHKRYEVLRELQELRSSPLHYSRWDKDKNGKLFQESKPFDLELLETELQSLNADLRECVAKIKEYRVKDRDEEAEYLKREFGL